MERTLHVGQASAWITAFVCVAAAWSLSPQGGLFTAVWTNLVLAGGLVVLSARVTDETQGRALVFLAVLPLARMADVITAVPLSTVGWSGVGTDLVVALGAACAWFLSPGRPQLGERSARGGISRKASGSGWAPKWGTLALFAGSCAAGVALHGREAVSLPLSTGIHPLEAAVIVFLVMLAVGVGVEAVFRGPLFEALRHAVGPVPAVALTSALWMVLGGYRPGAPAVLIALANVVYGVARARGERTLWVGVAHGLLNGCAMVAVHGLG